MLSKVRETLGLISKDSINMLKSSQLINFDNTFGKS
jgi:hypothetical protein